MRYLLDVNVLIALGFRRHGLHEQVAVWIRSRKNDRFLTCSITELGFVRILGNVRTYGMGVSRARELLLRLKKSSVMPLEFIADGNDVSFLPPWAKNFAQTTDGHLVQLASSNDAVLATMDKGIPGAFLIPSQTD
jgi:predicted nucleic acid-binding protein